MNKEDLPFTQQMQIKEANVRGVYISIACDFERMMADIIANCEIVNSAGRLEYKRKYINSLEMGKKVGRCEKVLKAYRNGIYYNKFSSQLNTLSGLVYYRNMLAHGYSNFDTNQKDMSFIIFENTIKGKTVLEKIEVQPFLMQMELHRANIMQMMNLAFILSIERSNPRRISPLN
jgi:hypothetical protein